MINLNPRMSVAEFRGVITLNPQMSISRIRDLITSRTTQTVYWSGGAYDLSGWGDALVIDSSLRMEASPDATLTGTAALGFLEISDLSSVALDGLRFDTWDVVLITQSLSTVGSLSVTRCRFEDVEVAVQTVGSCESVEISGNEAVNCAVDSAVFRIAGAFDSCSVVRNRGTGIGRSFISLGGTASGDEAIQDQWRRGVVTENIVDGMSRVGECHAVIVGGMDFIIANNIFTDCGIPTAVEAGSEVIYTKAIRSIICGNSITLPANSEEGNHAILLKGTHRNGSGGTGPAGYANIVSGNTITSDGDGTAIGSTVGELLVEGNDCEGLGELFSGSSPDGEIVVRGNVGRIMAGGIAITGQGGRNSVVDNELHIVGDAAQNRSGISMLPGAPITDDSRDWVVANNRIYGVGTMSASSRGILLYCGSGLNYVMDGIEVSGNRIRGFPFGIWSSASGLPVFSGDGAWILDNWLSCTTPIASSITGAAGVTVTGNL